MATLAGTLVRGPGGPSGGVVGRRRTWASLAEPGRPACRFCAPNQVVRYGQDVLLFMADRPAAVGQVKLRGRRSECAVLDGMIAAVREGESRTLVVRGEAGVGKTALLDYLLERASGCRIVRAAGVESEMELAFASLHQLCAPMLDHLGRLPAPQRDALEIAFGLRAGARRIGSWSGWRC